VEITSIFRFNILGDAMGRIEVIVPEKHRCADQVALVARQTKAAECLVQPAIQRGERLNTGPRTWSKLGRFGRGEKVSEVGRLVHFKVVRSESRFASCQHHKLAGFIDELAEVFHGLEVLIGFEKTSRIYSKQAQPEDLMDIFDSGSDIELATVEAQKAFAEAWFDQFRK
jgi:hypothetical protein